MGNENLQRNVREPDELDGEVLAPDGQHTGELSDVVILDPDGSAPPGAATNSAPTMVEEHGEDEVYVILPEGDTSEIPIVETHVLEDTAVDDESAETGDIEASETTPLDPEGALDTDSIDMRGASQFSDAATESDTQNLDEITSEIDDQVLAEEAGLTSEILSMPASLETARGVNDAGGHSTAAGSHETRSPPQARRWIKVAIAAAALVSISAAGFWYLGGFGDPLFQVGTHPVNIPGAATTGVSNPAHVEGGAVVVTNPVDPTGTHGSSTSTEHDVALASREAFRGKLLAALELGFGGEVKHE